MIFLSCEIASQKIKDGKADAIAVLWFCSRLFKSKDLLDELFSNLDYDLRSEMCEILRENLDGQNTILITSHQDIDTKWLDGTISVELTPGENFEKHSTFTIEQK